MSTLSDQIAALEATLNEAANRVTTDGVTVQYDLDAARRRLEELKRQQDGTRRPRVAQIDLSNTW